MAATITPESVWAHIPPRARDSHKGSFGAVLVVAGSACYRGAASLAVEGALRTGAGIVTLASVEPVLAAVSARLPECCLCPCLAGAEGGISPRSLPNITRQKATTLLLGPGLGYTAQAAARAAETRELVEKLLPGFGGSAVLDADGLNAAASLLNAGRALPHPAGELILTPHPGEMSRLTGLSTSALTADREGAACRFAREWNAVVVLKGAGTVVAAPDGRCRVNTTGNPGLSRGGSGDALAGMTAALLACGLPAYEAAACAVYLHGAAADRAAALRGEGSADVQQIFRNLVSAMLVNESVYMPINHYLLPLEWNGRMLFSEMWVDTDAETDRGDGSGRKDHGMKLLFKIDVQSLGFFDVILTTRGSEVEVQVGCPAQALPFAQRIEQSLTDIVRRNDLTPARVTVRRMDKPVTLTEVFPKIFEKRSGVNVRA